MKLLHQYLKLTQVINTITKNMINCIEGIT